MEREKERVIGNYKRISHHDVRLQLPADRLKSCYDKGNTFTFSLNKSPKIYLRSMRQLIVQGDVYTKEGNLELGYIYYVRSMTLFLEKLQNHPKFKTIDLAERNLMKNRIKEIFPKTEELKKKLLHQYELEHRKVKQELEEQIRIEEFIRREEEKQRLKEKEEEEEREREREKEKEKERQQMIASASNLNYFGIVAGARTSIDDDRSNFTLPVTLPSKNYITPHIGEQAQSSSNRKAPFIDRSTKPSSLTSNDKLRDIIVPSELMQKFLKLAFSNTCNNTETCGVLAGRLERNRLIITHFVIPKQTGSADSCITHNEEEIFDFQDQHDLISLGWIHTHPTQTAFLSSVDLHTHCSYQLMMAEAIAIVCAPKYQDNGFFHLTPEYGLNYIANCKETGFHPHPPEPPLFTTAKHFKLDQRATIEAVDLRRK